MTPCAQIDAMANAANISPPVLEQIREIGQSLVRLCFGFEAIEHILAADAGHGAIVWAVEQVDKEHVALSHKWSDLVEAMGLDADALNEEACEAVD